MRTAPAPSGARSAAAGVRHMPMAKYGPTVCDGVGRTATSAFERGGARAAQHDVEAVRERPIRLRRVEIELRDEPLARGGISYGLENRVVGEQRVARKVHLRHEPLGERAAEEREV